MRGLWDPASRVQTGAVRGADLVVGIPSFCEADSIPRVAEQVARGLLDYFPGRTSVIVNMDNASPDGTREAFLAADTGAVPKVYVSTPAGVRGKGHNLRNLFLVARAWRPRALAVVDADLLSITPEWVARLLHPILRGYDYAAPLYARHPHDGTITNHLCYPLLFALCGQDLRQPIGGEFAFAPWLMESWLAEPWPSSACEYGVDIAMTLEAVFQRARLAQVPLGTKLHKPSAPKLGPMFVQVVDSLFSLLHRHRRQWIADRGRRRAARMGWTAPARPGASGLDLRAMETAARAAYQGAAAVMAAVLAPGTWRSVSRRVVDGVPVVDTDLWVRCVYDGLVAYGGGQRRQAVTALQPLYMGRVMGFLRESRGRSAAATEAAIRRQALRFRRCRPQLLARLGTLPPVGPGPHGSRAVPLGRRGSVIESAPCRPGPTVARTLRQTSSSAPRRG